MGIGIGTNLGNRQHQMARAIAFLHSLSEGHFLCSSIWETEPVDCPAGSPKFLNAVAEIETRKPPRELLSLFQTYEKVAGRRPSKERNSPRTIDLDILYYGNLMLAEPDLVIPHPRASVRLFVLGPLSEICPTLVLPGQTRTVEELYRELLQNHPSVGPTGKANR
ncbi:2-amino-4-hydroxy-6-hydroxymethyldihydropteridine diphosphokinase [Candidatus Methylacidithermus pantelleriae]|uniref:2-amino-4-hydroxy-6-hydroxymethyldihydropteridine pyrophosphokinase n=1 Tax=Candidatus Methylacidithermus pantelleriae TaxID=2744239 RepID=A0A8J2BST2_9BACT|nr:2-amino-4-hydroxy-6-hydroxymethyldihydropteridine diphosphokinase [Candidatus Methylacidithermus pantelleriae]CAF0697533.1 Dihydroneopterin aldolase [Candidatus Methylacidithermus pantelleriae]